jgi:hypothetical protein
MLDGIRTTGDLPTRTPSRPRHQGVRRPVRRLRRTAAEPDPEAQPEATPPSSRRSTRRGRRCPRAEHRPTDPRKGLDPCRGQERILRRRIASVQNTKKITRAMELIAATRVVKAQERANEARPYAERDHPVILDLAAAGADVDHPLLREAPRGATQGRLSSPSPPTAASAAPTTHGHPRRRARGCRPRRADGRTTRWSWSARRPRLLPFRNYPIDRLVLSGITDQPTYEHAREIAAPGRDLFVSGELATGRARLLEFISPAPRRSVVRRFLPLESRPTMAQGRRRGAVAGFEYEPSPPRHARRRCCPATSSPGSTRRCSTPRPRSTPPASGP